MNYNTQKKVLEKINHLFDVDAMDLASSDLLYPAKNYSDPEYHKYEKEIIGKMPIIIGHSDSLPKVGSFITDNSTGVPILITRTENGIRAFLNVCTHRGANLCEEASGSRRIFTCPYHAWSFGLDGTLISAPKEHFPCLAERNANLVSLPVEERHGLIWIITTPGEEIDVARHLGPIDEQLLEWNMGDYVLERSTVLEEDLNWKYILDGFLEIYHIPPLHASSIAPYIYGKYCIYEKFGQHSRLIATRKSFDAFRHKPLDEFNFLAHLAVNHQVFPNTIIVWQGDHFEVWTSYPGSTPDKCSVRIQSLTTKEMATEEYRRRWDNNWKVLIGTVVEEDWPISKSVQKNIPFMKDGMSHFGRNEAGVQHLHTQLDAAVRKAMAK